LGKDAVRRSPEVAARVASLSDTPQTLLLVSGVVMYEGCILGTATISVVILKEKTVSTQSLYGVLEDGAGPPSRVFG
jgi:hypothetical protein